VPGRKTYQKLKTYRYMVSKKKKSKRKENLNTIEAIMLSFFSSFLLLEVGFFFGVMISLT